MPGASTSVEVAGSERPRLPNQDSSSSGGMSSPVDGTSLERPHLLAQDSMRSEKSEAYELSGYREQQDEKDLSRAFDSPPLHAPLASAYPVGGGISILDADGSTKVDPSRFFAAKRGHAPELTSSAAILGDDPTAVSKQKARHRAMKNLRTLCVIIGGWGVLVIGCVAFKLGAIAANLRAPDSLAEWTIRHPQFITQLWTMAGNILAEACLVLWSMSISYMAFRSVVFSKEKIELLTISAWTELNRAGYTFSRRRLSWPGLTLVVWLGSLFLAPGFTTLLTPAPIVYNTTFFSTELDQLSPAFSDRVVAGYNDSISDLTDLGCTGGMIMYHDTNLQANDREAFADANVQVAQNCNPSTSDIVGMLQASLSNAQTVLGQPNPLFIMAESKVFVGRTWGVLPLGPDGFSYLNDLNLRKPPPGASTPAGYELTHQALTANISCHPTTPDEQNMITESPGNRPDERIFTVQCPGSSLPPTNVLIPGERTVAPNLAAIGCPNTNGSKASQRTHTAFIQVIQAGEASLIVNGTIQDFTCVYTPYWHSATVAYPSKERVLNVTSSIFLSYADGLDGKIDDPEKQGPSSDNLTVTRQILSQQAFFGSLAVIDIFNLASTFAPSSVNAVNGTGIVSGNAWYTALLNALYQNPTYNNKKFQVTPEVLAASLQGMFDYQSSMARAFQSAKLRKARDARLLAGPNPTADDLRSFSNLVILGNGFVDSAVARTMEGTWSAQTLGWGSGTGVNDLTSTVVLLSLVPFFFFAICSWTVAIYAQLKYRQMRGYYGSFDPTDITEAIVAASAGGLKNAFDRRALSESDGLYGARKVKVRLGQVIDPNDPDGEPRLGFVHCD
ncbi:hypothetical protein OC834_001647 [Tilletia horrida]|nr:hypothetical protein OC834_001647 [Tilletia horrida]